MASRIKTTCRKCGNVSYEEVENRICPKCGSCNSFSELEKQIILDPSIQREIENLRIKGNHFRAEQLMREYMEKQK